MLQRLRASHSCGIGGGCRLSIDIEQSIYSWMCGSSGPLPLFSDASPQQAVLPRAVTSPQSLNEHVADAGTYFAGLPPLVNNETTNSFLYCPVLLHAAQMLHPQAAEAWLRAIPWFATVCQHLAVRTVSLSFLSNAYAELLQISCQHDVAMVQHFKQTGDAAAAH